MAPTSQTRRKREGRKQVMSESPYFKMKREQSSTPKQHVDMSHHKSRHFATSSASAFGSILSLGPFLSTLSDLDLPEMCDRSKRRFRSDVDFCSSCKPFAEAAMSHFSGCPFFKDNFQALKRGEQSNLPPGKTCLELFDLIVFKAACHLCSNACYSKAFKPARDWHARRMTVAGLSNGSPDVWMCDLRCCLARESIDAEHLKVDVMSATQADDARLSPIIKRNGSVSTGVTKTVFIHKSGKTFRTESQLLKHIGLSGWKKNQSARLENPSARRRLKLDTESPAKSRTADQSICKYEQRISTWILRVCLDAFPVSPFGLLEELFSSNPWRLLLSTIMLNRTRRNQVDIVLHKFLTIWPDPKRVILAQPEDLVDVIRPLGICRKRAHGIIRFSTEYLQLIKRKMEQRGNGAVCTECDPPTLKARSHGVVREEFLLTEQDVLSLYNCGRYAYDAYRIFVQGDRDAVATDHALRYCVDYFRGLTSSLAGKSSLEQP